MGKWATHVGYELVDAYLNRNYSMEYMFSYGPFFSYRLKSRYYAWVKVGIYAWSCKSYRFCFCQFAKKYCYCTI